MKGNTHVPVPVWTMRPDYGRDHKIVLREPGIVCPACLMTGDASEGFAGWERYGEKDNLVSIAVEGCACRFCGARVVVTTTVALVEK